MSENDVSDEGIPIKTTFNLEDMANLRARIHNQNDMIQAHEVKLGQHDILLRRIEEQIQQMRASSVTGEQLSNAVTMFGLKLELATVDMSAKLAKVSSDLDPIRRGIWWAVTLVLGAVILAVLELAVKKP